MAEGPSPQKLFSRESDWCAPLDEGYWGALLEQGEYPSRSIPPRDPQEGDGSAILGETPDSHVGDPRQGVSARLPPGDVWQTAQEVADRGDRFRLPVCGANRGGLLVEWNGLQGFVPASHLLKMPRGVNLKERLADLLGRVDDTLTLRVIEVNRTQERLVLSERAAESTSSSSAEVFSSLHVGEIRRGRVTNLTSFGAFVDLGGVEGLVHVSELAWSRVRHPSDLLHPGEEVEVQILGVHPDKGRVALSMKRTCPNPWGQVESRYHVGQVVEGTLTTVVDFGALMLVEDGLEGLVHASELCDGGYLQPRSVVRNGDTVRVRILNIDANNRRMGLSMRHAGGRVGPE